MDQHASHVAFQQYRMDFLSSGVQTSCEVFTTITTPSTLLSLAPELLFMVAGNLDTFDRMSLKFTSRHLYQSVQSFSATELPLVQAQLYKQRGPSTQAVPGSGISSAKYPYLACMKCLRLRPSIKFANDQQRHFPVLKKIPRNLQPKDTYLRYRLLHRMCISCAIKKKEPGYQQGQIITVNEQKFVVCNYCGKYGIGGNEGSRRQAAGLCEVCWAFLEGFWGRGADREVTEYEEDKSSEYGD